MKRAWFLLAALGLFLAPRGARGAEPIKIKHVQSVYAGAGGVALKSPEGVGCGENALFVADSGNKRIVRYGYKDGVATPEAAFPEPGMFPLMVQPTPGGDLYVLDGKNRKVSILGPDGAFKRDLAPKGVPGDQNVVPRSIRIDAEGTLYVLDVFGARVLVLKGDGTFVREVPFPKDYGFFSDVAVDEKGTIFILDSVKAEVYAARKDEKAFSALTGSMKSNMNFPTSLAPDNNGHLYLLDQHGSGLAVVGMDGTFLGRKLRMGWSDGFLYYPSQISINSSGDIFIADKGNNRVQEFEVAQ